MRHFIAFFSIIFLTSCGDKKELVTERFNSGAIESQGTLVNGVKEGKWIYFHPEGDTAKIEHYKSGELFRLDSYAYGGWELADSAAEGTYRYERTQIKNEEKNGAFTSFRRNGTIDAKGYYLNNLKTDTMKSFSEDGYFIGYTVYERDTSTYFKINWPNGQTRILGENGFNGRNLVYDSLGNLELELLFDMNEGTVDTLKKYNR
ncbi:MAG: hypothetical protein RLN88_06545 [Ekhidna sp.]|uniref:hypothetical protein n=1 Tax=Ekhidna sp. TaxID=2608089 RepID=UPI0032EFAD20